MKSRCNDQIQYHGSIFMRNKNIWEFHRSFTTLWKVVEAAVLVIYMFVKYESIYTKRNLYNIPIAAKYLCFKVNMHMYQL